MPAFETNSLPLRKGEFSNHILYYLNKRGRVLKHRILTLSFHRWLPGTSFCRYWSIFFLFP